MILHPHFGVFQYYKLQLTEERDETLKELESLRAAAATSASTSASVTAAGFEALEVMLLLFVKLEQDG